MRNVKSFAECTTVINAATTTIATTAAAMMMEMTVAIKKSHSGNIFHCDAFKRGQKAKRPENEPDNSSRCHAKKTLPPKKERDGNEKNEKISASEAKAIDYSKC